MAGAASTPRVHFVGHAGVVIEAGGARVWTDPWLISDVFNDAWRLYPAPRLGDTERDSVTHIWITHEHPDHLNIPTLQALPEAMRAQTTVLFQEHYSSEVSDFLRSLRFKEVIELGHGKAHQLTPDLRVTCHQVGHEDAAMTFESGRWTILNLNDCKPTQRGLRRILPERPVDVLLDQFSIAGWNGNPDDVATKAAHAQEALDELLMHIAVVTPTWLIPFASFVRFSHEENAHLNRGINTIDTVAEHVSPARMAVMYPGDVWPIDGLFAGTQDAMDRYRSDYESLDDLPLTRHEPVPVDVILFTIEERLADIRNSFHRTVLARIPELTFHITDQDAYLRVSLVDGARITEGAETHCIVHLGSQAAWYTFKHRWAIPTLLISGRFTLEGNESDWNRFKQLGAAYASGYHSRGLIGGISEPRKRHFWMRRVPDVFDQFLPKAASTVRGER